MFGLGQLEEIESNQEICRLLQNIQRIHYLSYCLSLLGLSFASFGGRRGSMPVQYVLQATNLEKLEEVLPKFMAKVYELSLIHI